MIRQRGFTLIEIMVVMSITAVLGTVGIAGFIEFNKTQTLTSSANDVITMLTLARSRSLSQIKPASLCPTGNLDGYVVQIATPRSYFLRLRCSGTDITISEENKLLPEALSFASSTSFFFPIKVGGVQTAGQIVVNGYGKSKTIVVNSLGGISQ